MKRFIGLLTIGLVTFVLPLARFTYAASSSLYLSPASGSVVKGSILTISVRENSGSQPVDTVQANLTYPANLLDYVSIGSSSAFSVVAQNSGGSGSVQIARGALPAVTGDQLVASVKFKALTSSSTASISFAGGSAVVSGGKDITGAKSGGNYTLNPAPVAPPAPPPDTTPPAIKSVIAGDITTKSAVISWTTSEPANSEVDYGVNNNYGLVAVDSSYVTDHKIILSSAISTPDVLYHFMVKSIDPSGNASSSPDSTFITKVSSLLVTVVNQNNKSVSGAKVTFSDHSGITDKAGQVTIQSLPLGKLIGTVTYKGKQNVVSVQVADLASNGKPQAVTFKILTSNSYAWWAIGVLAVILLLGITFIISRRGGGGLSGNLKSKFLRHRLTDGRKGNGGVASSTVVLSSTTLKLI